MRSAVLYLLVLGTAFAQSGAITGAITDPDGGAVANASVRAKNTATGKIFQASSLKDGKYTVSALPAGSYELTVPPIGFTFEKLEQKNVTVQAAQTLRLDLKLKWGGNLGTPGDDPFTFNRSKWAPSGKPAPRTAEGKPDLSGVWYANHAEWEKASMLPWAEAITKQREAADGAGDPGEFCLPGNPLLTATLYYKIVQTPKTIVMLWEGDPPNFRQVFLDQHDHSKAWFPTWLGHSIAKWDGDTLVVDTAAFNDRSWLELSPHTEKLHVTERWRRPELARLEKEFTIEDPETFTKPWKTRPVWNLDLGDEIFEYICNENEKDVPHLLHQK